MRPRKRIANNLWILMLVFLTSPSFAAAQTNSSRTREASEAIRRGNAHYAKAEYEAAIAEYRSVSGDGQSYAQSLYNTGVCYYELWRTEEATQMYRQAIAARQGRYPAALYALGVALEDLNRLPEAQEVYQQAIIASGGKHAPAHYHLGLLMAYARDYDAAAAFFRKAITLSHDQLPASHNNLGVVLALNGHLKEAEREFETALNQAHGVLPEVAVNLRLCRAQLLSAKADLATLKLTKATASVVAGDR